MDRFVTQRASAQTFAPSASCQAMDAFGETGCLVSKLFEAQAARTPDAVAASFGQEVLLYRDLNECANRLAHCLTGMGVGPQDIVALAIPPSFEMVIGLLGVLKSGAAYLPLPSDSPPDRITFLLDDARAAALLSLSASAPHDVKPKLLLLDSPETQKVLAASSNENPETRARPDNPAYVIYTSGSTGQPKGVIVNHRELGLYLSWATRLYESHLGTGAPINTPLAFDATVTSLYLPLISGKQVILLSEDRQLEALADLLAGGADLTLVKLTPAHLQVLESLLGNRASAVRARRFVVGGEALTESAVSFWRTQAPQVRIVNEYGPTEAVVGCCVFELDQEPDPTGPVPIGKPTPHTQLYLLGPDSKPVPDGAAGELYIGGPQLAGGYLHRTDLTAERFLPDPFASGARMYRTGDMARRRSDGNLEFLGRTDHQVKIRGYRIELGEIEAALTQCPNVRSGVVTTRQTTIGHQLVAYYAPHRSPAPAVEDLKAFLRLRLPDYMIPARFVALDALPLNANGKVDREALPAPARDEKHSAYTPPAGKLELAVAQNFAQILERDSIGATESFFDLGGDSLAVAILLTRIRKHFGVRVQMLPFLQDPTVRGLAALIERRASQPGRSLVPFQASGSGYPFFCVHGLGGLVVNFRDLAKSVGPDQPFFGLQAVGIDDDEAPHIRVAQMASHYIAQMRQVQPSGPFHIGGWSFGGWIAFEIARQLSAAGEEVPLLALLDSSAPQSISLNGLADFLSAKAGAVAKTAKAHFHRLSEQDLGGKVGYLSGILRRNMNNASFELRYRTGNSVAHGYESVGQAHLIAQRTYAPGPYFGPATLFRTEERSAAYPLDPTLGWGKLIRGRLTIQAAPGNHSSMLSQPHVQVLAEKICAAMTPRAPISERPAAGSSSFRAASG